MERTVKRMREEGILLCVFTCEREATGLSRADELYARFCASAEAYVAEVVKPSLWQAYVENGDPRKRFRHTPTPCRCRIAVISRAESSVTVEGELLCGERVVRRFVHLWDGEKELLVPPKRSRRKKGKK